MVPEAILAGDQYGTVPFRSVPKLGRGRKGERGWEKGRGRKVVEGGISRVKNLPLGVVVLVVLSPEIVTWGWWLVKLGGFFNWTPWEGEGGLIDGLDWYHLNFGRFGAAWPTVILTFYCIIIVPWGFFPFINVCAFMCICVCMFVLVGKSIMTLGFTWDQKIPQILQVSAAVSYNPATRGSQLPNLMGSICSLLPWC